MADPDVRVLGSVVDQDGIVLRVGVDHDCVTVSRWKLTQEQAENFAFLFTRACWEAARYQPD